MGYRRSDGRGAGGRRTTALSIPHDRPVSGRLARAASPKGKPPATFPSYGFLYLSRQTTERMLRSWASHGIPMTLRRVISQREGEADHEKCENEMTTVGSVRADHVAQCMRRHYLRKGERK